MTKGEINETSVQSNRFSATICDVSTSLDSFHKASFTGDNPPQKNFFYVRAKAYKCSRITPFVCNDHSDTVPSFSSRGNTTRRITIDDVEQQKDKIIGSPFFYEHLYHKKFKIGHVIDVWIDSDDWLQLSVIIPFSDKDDSSSDDDSHSIKELKKQVIRDIQSGKLTSFSIAYLSRPLESGGYEKQWMEVSVTGNPDTKGAGGKSSIIIAHSAAHESEEILHEENSTGSMSMQSTETSSVHVCQEAAAATETEKQSQSENTPTCESSSNENESGHASPNASSMKNNPQMEFDDQRNSTAKKEGVADLSPDQQQKIVKELLYLRKEMQQVQDKQKMKSEKILTKLRQVHKDAGLEPIPDDHLESYRAIMNLPNGKSITKTLYEQASTCFELKKQVESLREKIATQESSNNGVTETQNHKHSANERYQNYPENQSVPPKTNTEHREQERPCNTRYRDQDTDWVCGFPRKDRVPDEILMQHSALGKRPFRHSTGGSRFRDESHVQKTPKTTNVSQNSLPDNRTSSFHGDHSGLLDPRQIPDYSSRFKNVSFFNSSHTLKNIDPEVYKFFKASCSGMSVPNLSS